MKSKRKKTKTIERGDVTPKDAIAQVKEEILEHVRMLSDGRSNVIYPIVAAGKQLLELERAQPAKEDF